MLCCFVTLLISTDIDECAEGTYRCTAPESICFNTRGSYKCPQVTCPPGFVRTPMGSRRNRFCISVAYKSNNKKILYSQVSLLVIFIPIKGLKGLLHFKDRKFQMKYHTHKCNDPCTDIRNCTHLTTTEHVVVVCT